jgi:hypothetical protein
MGNTHPLFPLQQQTRKAIAAHLHISYDTLKRRAKAKQLSLPKGRMLTPDEQRILLKEIGYHSLLERYDHCGQQAMRR